MQAIMETLFDIVYLTLVITVGIRMMLKSRGEKQYFLFGMMAVILGTGDALPYTGQKWSYCLYLSVCRGQNHPMSFSAK